MCFCLIFIIIIVSELYLHCSGNLFILGHNQAAVFALYKLALFKITFSVNAASELSQLSSKAVVPRAVKKCQVKLPQLM